MVRKRGYQPKKRNSNSRKEKRVFLLAAEGKNKTEQNYFSHFRSEDIIIRFVRGNYTDPVQMTRRLLADYNEYDLSDADYAACFVDSDFDAKKDIQLEKADKLIKKCKKQNIHLLVSSPCFEIWYICHFTYTTMSYNNTDEVLKKLATYIHDYQKGDEDTFFPLLSGKTEIAIKNAKKLEQYCIEAQKKWHHVEFMPSTEIYKVFEEFLVSKCNR